MKQAELIIFLVVLAVNGGIAIWKKMKEREAAKQAATAQQVVEARVQSPARTAVRAKQPAAPQAGVSALDVRLKKARAEARRAKAAAKEAAAKKAAPAARPVPPPSGADTRPGSEARAAAPSTPSQLALAAASVRRTPGARVNGARATGAGRLPLVAKAPTSGAALRQAIVAAEILGPPRSIRSFGT